MIPRIIHQVWIQGLYETPRRYRRWAATWAELNPGWEHRIWDETSLISLMTGLDPRWLEVFSSQPDTLGKADVARYCLLQTFGGVYADMDTTCLRPIGPVLNGSQAGFQASIYRLPFQRSLFPDAPWDLLTNSVVASPPGHEIWERVLKQLHDERGRNRWVIERTGPRLLWPIVRRYAGESPGDVRLIGTPEIHTAFYLPRRWMRFQKRLRRRLCVVDYNESGRCAMREALRFRNLPGSVRAIWTYFTQRSTLALFAPDSVEPDECASEANGPPPKITA
jgi:Glycosyltransferase sugar-binding region containing DXD motif